MHKPSPDDPKPSTGPSYDVLNTTNDFWQNPVQIIRIKGPTDDSHVLEKQYFSKKFELAGEKRNLLLKVIKGVSHPFMQSANIRQGAERLSVTFDYDLTDLKSLIEHNLKQGKAVTENQLMIVCKALIDLGSVFENFFCFVPEISLKSLKVFKIIENHHRECGVRLQNPFINDDYLLEILEVG